MAFHWILALGLLLLQAAATIAVGEKMFFLQQESDEIDSKSKLLVVTWSSTREEKMDNCELFTDKASITAQLNSTPQSEVRKTTEEEMKNAQAECDEQLKGRPEEGSVELPGEMAGPTKPTKEGYDGWNVIFPGTKWCGAGDVADGYDDVGMHADTDKCCRAHDLCNDTLAPGETRNGLTSKSPFTTLSCKCDNDFYDCLERVDSIISNKIGNMYFNLLRRECYEADYPLTKKCKTFRSFLKITCKEYARNTNVPKVYQWKSPRLYKKLPIPGPLTITLPF